MSEYVEGQKIKVRTDYDGCGYITAGKVYEGVVVEPWAHVGFEIEDDDGDKIYCLLLSGGHIDGHAWEVVE